MKTTSTYDDIYDAIYDGMNIRILLMEVGIDKESFWWYMEYRKFTPSQLKKINAIIIKWRDESNGFERESTDIETE
jgi:hypothetical protein